MTEMIVALLMIVNGEIKEARIQPSFGKCMERGRIAKRDLKLLGKTNIKYQCIKSMAELEDNIDGSKSIKKLILK
tara:strand:+ start:784 stop:1008 length:225 start_codon:yes stop_codon:yes gene_type:complete